MRTDVILPEILPPLHLDEYQQLLARVLNPVKRPFGDADALTRADSMLLSVDSDLRRTPDDLPVFLAFVVFLIAQAVPGEHFYPFYLEFRLIVEYQPGAPGRGC